MLTSTQFCYLCGRSLISSDRTRLRIPANGKDLTGWKGDMKHWSVEDSRITGQTTTDNPLGYNTFLVWKGAEPGDFELRLK